MFNEVMAKMYNKKFWVMNKHESYHLGLGVQGGRQ